MRFVRNAEQTPEKLLSPQQRKSAAYLALVLGLIVVAVGTAGFFLGFILRDNITQWGLNYRDVQTYAIAVAFVGAFLYSISALILKVGLRQTTFYKITTMLKDEPFDPPVQGDHTKRVLSELRYLNEEWAIFRDISPTGAGNKEAIPFVLCGPKGVYAITISAGRPGKKNFVDPAPMLTHLSKSLNKDLETEVTSLVLFMGNPVNYITKSKVEPLNINRVYRWIKEQEDQLDKPRLEEVEKRLFKLINPQHKPKTLIQ